MRNAEDIEAYLSTGKVLSEGEEEQDGYFHMCLHLPSTPSAAGEKKEWLLPLTTHTRFPVQFVRSTLAKLLDLPQLADWKSALQEQGQTADGVENGEDVERANSAGFRSLVMAKST